MRQVANQAFFSSLISWILRCGVLLSSVCIVLGLLLMLAKPGMYSLYSFPLTAAQLWMDLQELQPEAVITLGLFLLMATPVVRVAVSILAFAAEHDIVFVCITAVVLAVLLFSAYGALPPNPRQKISCFLNFSQALRYRIVNVLT